MAKPKPPEKEPHVPDPPPDWDKDFPVRDGLPKCSEPTEKIVSYWEDILRDQGGEFTEQDWDDYRCYDDDTKDAILKMHDKVVVELHPDDEDEEDASEESESEED